MFNRYGALKMAKIVLNLIKVYRSKNHGLTLVGQTETAKIWMHQDGKFVVRGDLPESEERAILSELSYQLNILLDIDAADDL